MANELQDQSGTAFTDESGNPLYSTEKLTLVNIVGARTVTKSTGSCVVPVFDTVDGELQIGQYAVDGPNAIVRLSTGETCTVPASCITGDCPSLTSEALIKSMTPN